MWIAIGIFVVLAAFSIVWIIAERRWDGRQFFQKKRGDFVINIDAKSAIQLLAEQPETQPIDVRPEDKYRKSHIPRAVNCPLTQGEFDYSEIESTDRELPILVYCDGGYRSRKAITHLTKLGFTSIYHLHRGIISWKLRGGNCDEEETASTS